MVGVALPHTWQATPAFLGIRFRPVRVCCIRHQLTSNHFLLADLLNDLPEARPRIAFASVRTEIWPRETRRNRSSQRDPVLPVSAIASTLRRGRRNNSGV